MKAMLSHRQAHPPFSEAAQKCTTHSAIPLSRHITSYAFSVQTVTQRPMWVFTSDNLPIAQIIFMWQWAKWPRKFNLSQILHEVNLSPKPCSSPFTVTAETSSLPRLSMMVSLECQPHRIQKHHGNKHLGMTMVEFLDRVYWSGKTQLKCGRHQSIG